MSSLIGGLHPQPVLVMLWWLCCAVPIQEEMQAGLLPCARSYACPAALGMHTGPVCYFHLHLPSWGLLPWRCIQGRRRLLNRMTARLKHPDEVVKRMLAVKNDEVRAFQVMCNNYEGKLVQESPFSEKRRGKERVT
eukprot:1142657-Pelagomonas_calceolata.AAC.1